jgi:hypothetical protein
MYALNLWPALVRYCDDGAIEIDNSAAERALRGIPCSLIRSKEFRLAYLYRLVPVATMAACR